MQEVYLLPSIPSSRARKPMQMLPSRKVQWGIRAMRKHSS
jgi:hypothetical protein